MKQQGLATMTTTLLYNVMQSFSTAAWCSHFSMLEMDRQRSTQKRCWQSKSRLLFFLLKTSVFASELVWVNSGTTLEIIGKVFQLAVFCYKNERVPSIGWNLAVTVKFCYWLRWRLMGFWRLQLLSLTPLFALLLLVSFIASTMVEAVVENGWACLHSSRSSTHKQAVV